MYDCIGVIYVKIRNKLDRAIKCKLLSFPVAIHMFQINIGVIKSVDNMKLNQYFLCIIMLWLSGCAWVETTKEGGEVLLVKSYNVQSCQHLGSTRSTVKHEIGPITRSEDKVREELVTLAKNHAADMGGDSIVAAGPATDGSMTFDVYKCGDSP